MAIFKILKGAKSRIGTETTPFHEGYAYFTPEDGGLYIDSTDSGSQKRIRVTGPTDNILELTQEEYEELEKMLK